MSDVTYKIVRRFANDAEFPDVDIAEGLTLSEAKAHCKDPETSSRTCTNPEGIALTEKCGVWFDTWQEE